MKTRVDPIVLSIEQMCDALDIGKNSAYELLNSGEVDAFKIGSCWKIPVKSVEEYMDRKVKEHKAKVMCEIVDEK